MRPGRHEATAGDAMDDDSRRTVRFYVGGEHAIESEGMWADETPAGTYLVKNIPFFAYQVSYQDEVAARWCDDGCLWALGVIANSGNVTRSEEHTSELQSRGHLVCRLLLEKKKKYNHL